MLCSVRLPPPLRGRVGVGEPDAMPDYRSRLKRNTR